MPPLHLTPLSAVLVAAAAVVGPALSLCPSTNDAMRTKTAAMPTAAVPPLETAPFAIGAFAIVGGHTIRRLPLIGANVHAGWMRRRRPQFRTRSPRPLPPLALSHATGRALRLTTSDDDNDVDTAAVRIEVAGAGAGAEEGGWNPKDPASTTPQLLSALWSMIAQGTGMKRGETMTVKFPMMEKQFSPSYLGRLTGHLDTCKDVCDDFGINTLIVPYARPGDPAKSVVGFTVKSYRNPDKLDDDGEYKFDPDPFWDDVTDEDFNYIQELTAEDEREEDGDGCASTDLYGVDESDLPEADDSIPDDDEDIIDATRRWVDKMMSDLALCPFTSGPDMAGLPMGKVFYTVDRSKSFEDMYARYWKEVVRVEQNTEKDLSTTLLIAPEFCADNVESYENFCGTLTQPLEALAVEELLQLVFFHPKWTFRDGGERSGIGLAANYARRSPWPMINILRTKQVRAAQKGIPTGLVYKQNERTLGMIGTKRLETMLRLRDWSGIKDEEKVDRRGMEALRVAGDMQSAGGLIALEGEELSVAADATPAANKVGDEQIEGSNMVNVVIQALDKRLAGRQDGGVQRLTGPETSAAMMASDFLLGRLRELQGAAAAAASATATSTSSAQGGGRGSNPYFDVHDDFATSAEKEEQELDVLFGGTGIMKSSDDDYGF